MHRSGASGNDGNSSASSAESSSPAGVVSTLGLGTHVLIDYSGLDRRRTNATFTLHHPVKDPNNPIIREDQPWEDRLHMFGSVVQVPPPSQSPAGPPLWRIYYLIDGPGGLHNCVVRVPTPPDLRAERERVHIAALCLKPHASRLTPPASALLHRATG
eukprot:COSAG06_NODE_13586_length_1242_cov_1.235346_2_plen_158_part_00